MSQEGEIKARLTLDGSDYEAGIDKAIAKADELTSVDPKIRVTTEGTGKAVAELEAVKAAEDKVEQGQRKLTAAQKDGQKQAVDWRGALVGSLVAVSAAAPPVAAGAVGITGAFGVMAGAGILGLAGIVRGLKENNAVGQQYRSTVDSLTASFHSAQDAAAGGLFPGVQASAQLLARDMPAINSEVSHFAGLLGGMLPTGLDATVTLLERANPLLDQAGQYLGSLITGLDQWSHSNGYQNFLDYSIQELPQVEHLLGDAGHLVVDFLTAWAPVGTQTLPLLDGIVTGVDDIVKHTGPLVPAAVAVVGAFNLLKPVYGTLSNIVTGLRNVGSEAVTTAGKVAVLNAAERGGGGFGPGAFARAGSKGALLGTPMALDGTTLGIGTAGSIGLGVAAGGIAALGLGSVVLANALGPQAVSADKLQTGNATAAYNALVHPENLKGRGGTNAQSSSEMLHQFAQNGGQGGFVNGVAGFFGGQTGIQINNLDTAMASLAKSGNGAQAAAIIKKLGVSAADAAVDFPKYTAAVGSATHATAAVPAPVKAATAAYQQLVTQEGAAYTAQQKLATGNQNLEGTTDSAKDAIAGLSASFKANGASLNQNTSAGRANREAVLGAVQAIQAHGAAINADGQHAAEAAVSNDKMAISLEKTMEQFGVSKPVAEAYVKSLLGIPKNVSTAAQLKADEAILKAKQAKQAAVDFAKGDYKGALALDNSKAMRAKVAAAEAAQAFAKGDYQAALKADPSPANKAKADAMSKAEAFAKAQYEAKYAANPSNANKAAMEAAAKAHWFGNGYYNAYLRAHSNAASVAGAAAAALNSVQSREVYLTVYASIKGNANAAQVAMNASRYSADGGTITSHGSIRGLADGGSPYFSGTVSGPGNAWNDQAGLWALANSEEVISNKYGQADMWRPALKAMNAHMSPAAVLSKVAKIAGQATHQGPTTVITRTIEPHITIQYPVTQDPETAAREAAQYIQAYSGI